MYKERNLNIKKDFWNGMQQKDISTKFKISRTRVRQILNKKFKYCQSQIEDRKKCFVQCEHCFEYYKNLENGK